MPEPAPMPTALPTLPPRTPDAARATAIVYQEWINRSELVECLHAGGFNVEVRIVDQSDLLEVTAHYLGVEPATAHPEAPLPMLRQPDLYLGPGEVIGDGEVGPCVLPGGAIDAGDEAAVSVAVDKARGDADFLATIAEQVWVQQHPAEVTHQISLLRSDQQGAQSSEASEAWSEQLAVVTQAIQDGTVWVPFTTGHTQEFAQSVGLVGSGGAVAVRVSAGDVLLDDGTYMAHTDFIRCGPVTMSVGAHDPWGTEEDLRDVVHAMRTGCAALIEAGFAQAETLAEVYWD